MMTSTELNLIENVFAKAADYRLCFMQPMTTIVLGAGGLFLREIKQRY